uniref:Uncharacterized protein n=1 Tax=Cacopsylla melanoneura TaxID=428564 RepID=A0A8D9EPB6_9HEMI
MVIPIIPVVEAVAAAVEAKAREDRWRKICQAFGIRHTRTGGSTRTGVTMGGGTNVPGTRDSTRTRGPAPTTPAGIGPARLGPTSIPIGGHDRDLKALARRGPTLDTRFLATVALIIDTGPTIGQRHPGPKQVFKGVIHRAPTAGLSIVASLQAPTSEAARPGPIITLTAPSEIGRRVPTVSVPNLQALIHQTSSGAAPPGPIGVGLRAPSDQITGLIHRAPTDTTSAPSLQAPTTTVVARQAPTTVVARRAPTILILTSEVNRPDQIKSPISLKARADIEVDRRDLIDTTSELFLRARILGPTLLARIIEPTLQARIIGPNLQARTGGTIEVNRLDLISRISDPDHQAPMATLTAVSHRGPTGSTTKEPRTTAQLDSHRHIAPRGPRTNSRAVVTPSLAMGMRTTTSHVTRTGRPVRQERIRCH